MTPLGLAKEHGNVMMSDSANRASGSGASVIFDHVSHGYIQHDQALAAVLDISLHISAGQFVALVGPSGCGKTTLLSMLAGLITPQHGEVRIADRVVTGASLDVAYMPARDALLPWRTARENVELGLIVRHMKKPERHRRADTWLEKVGLGDFGNSRIGELSQGMRQRVAIVRTLVLEPRCLLMDEPFAALDAQTKISARAEFMRLWADQGCTVVLVTHDLAEAVSLADRVILLSNSPGTVVYDVPVELPRPRSSGLAGADNDFVMLYHDLADALARETVGKNPDISENGRL